VPSDEQIPEGTQDDHKGPSHLAGILRARAIGQESELLRSLFLFPSPPQKKVKERVAALARPRQSGNTLFYSGVGGLAANQSDF